MYVSPKEELGSLSYTQVLYRLVWDDSVPVSDVIGRPNCCPQRILIEIPKALAVP